MSIMARSARVAAGAAAGTLLLLPLTACSSYSVACSGNECTATLSGDGAEATILGTELSYGGTEDGRATVTVGNTSVTCAEGESVSAGPLSLTCTTVDSGSVELSASLG